MAANGVMNETTNQRRYRGKYDNPRPRTVFQSVKDFLRAELADGKKVHKKDLEKLARERGIQTYPFADAKTALGLISEKSIERPNEALWSLPEQEPVAVVKNEETVDPKRTHHLCQDEFSVTVEERKKFGIKDNEQVMWIRDSRVWQKIEMKDSTRAFLRDNAGSRIIYHNGEMVTNGNDVVLAVRPMQEVEALREREQRAANEIARQTAEGKLRDDDFNKNDDERLRAQMVANSYEHQLNGMIGPSSPSSGMAFEDYIRNRGLTKAEIEQEELSYSLGNSHSREISDEEMEATIAANRRSGGRGEQGRGTSGKIYSLPPNIRPRNLAAR